MYFFLDNGVMTTKKRWILLSVFLFDDDDDDEEEEDEEEEEEEEEEEDYFFFFSFFYFFSLQFISESWQKINTDPVCFGARDDQYGVFNITKSGRLKTMKLVHKSGSFKCNANVPASHWGCTFQPAYNNNGLMTIITNANKEAVLPSAEELKTTNKCAKKHFYSLNETSHTSPELIFPDLPKKVSVSQNQEMQIWYGQDWMRCFELDNTGITCVDVYAWYA